MLTPKLQKKPKKLIHISTFPKAIFIYFVYTSLKFFQWVALDFQII